MLKMKFNQILATMENPESLIRFRPLPDDMEYDGYYPIRQT
jgi:hypothetical protein